MLPSSGEFKKICLLTQVRSAASRLYADAEALSFDASANFFAIFLRRSMPNCPSLRSAVVAMYWSRPPFLDNVRNALAVIFTTMVSPRTSLRRCLTCTLGLNHLLVFCREFGTLLPDWICAPSYRPRWARLNTTELSGAEERLESGDEREAVMPERPGPEPNAPR